MKVLIAEDDQFSRNLLSITLEKWSYDVVAVEDGREAWEELRKGEIQLVITDWMMPNMDGPALCREIRRTELSHYVYIIILTAKGDRDDLVAGMSAGADDYLIKPVDFDELKVRLRAGERIIDLERRLSEAQKRLEVLATTDELTGLLNRREILRRFDQELARCERDNASLAVVIADVDHFKKVNDTYGHAAGDMVLKLVTNRLQKALRPYDLIGRFGGEEFLFLVPKTTFETVMEIAERLRQAVSSAPISVPGEASLNVTASFGAALLEPKSRMRKDSLLGLADKALYEAKARGRNRVCFAGDDKSPILPGRGD